MKTILTDVPHDPELSDAILSYLPTRLADELRCLPCRKVDEIRLRCGGCCSVTSDGKSIPLKSGLNRNETDIILKKMCDGSLYAYADTINRGYITLPGGIRTGICGRAVTEHGRVTGVFDISALCIRIPHNITGVGGTVCRILKSSRFTDGVLVYSLPGIGKTTLLRSVIISLSGGTEPIRVAVIDTRGELGCRLPAGLCVDLLSGYPRGDGIEIAARTLNPQLIVCDEIGADPAEASAILAAHNCGVPLLASAHAADTDGLLRKTGIRMLHNARIFGCYVGISRGGGIDYRYTVTPSNAVDLD